jgi:hypothetical protein
MSSVARGDSKEKNHFTAGFTEIKLSPNMSMVKGAQA